MKQFFRFTFVFLVSLSANLFFSCNSSSNQNINDLLEIDNATRYTEGHLNFDNEKMNAKLELFKVKNENADDSLNYIKFMQLEKAEIDICHFISVIQGKLINMSEGFDGRIGDTLRYSLLTNPTETNTVDNIMFGPSPDGNFAERLSDGISKMQKLLDSSPSNSANSYPIKITGKEYFETFSRNTDKWEVSLFKNRSLINALVLLNSIRLEIVVALNTRLHQYVDERFGLYLSKLQVLELKEN